MFQELLIYGAPALTFGLGYFARNLIDAKTRSAEIDQFAEPMADWEQRAEQNWSRFVDACRECNTIEEELQDALASNRRLTDALQAKNERLERIVEAFEGQQSGTAQKAVRMARGDC